MATNDDFDLSSLFQGPGAVISGVLGVADNARKTIGGVMETIASLQRAAVAVEQLVGRMNRLVDDLEMPMRALMPELEKSVARMQRLSAAMEGPLDRLLPSLEAAVGTFDRVALSQLPESVDEARQQMQALIEMFGEIPRRLAQLSGRTGLAALFPLSGLGSSRPTSPPRVVTVAAAPRVDRSLPKATGSAKKPAAAKRVAAGKGGSTKRIAKTTKTKKSASTTSTKPRRSSAKS